MKEIVTNLEKYVGEEQVAVRRMVTPLKEGGVFWVQRTREYKGMSLERWVGRSGLNILKLNGCDKQFVYTKPNGKPLKDFK